MDKKQHISLSYLFFSFLKIGSVSWGGFMSLISVVREQLAEKDKVIKDEIILDGVSMASVLPGPVAFNVVTYIGFYLRGIPGAAVSMLGILLPSFILILGLAMVYSAFGHIPVFTSFFQGVLPCILAIIISVAINMSKKQIKGYSQVIIAVVSFFALIFVHSFFTTLGVIAVSAVAGFFLFKEKGHSEVKSVPEKKTTGSKKYLLWIIPVLLLVLIITFLPEIFGGNIPEKMKLTQKIFLTFSGMSVTLFGGGYIIIPAIQQIVVDGLHWLTVKEFADAIAMGQITPGPIFVSATFIGYKVGGFAGALAATIGIFFPPAAVMLFFSRFIDLIKKSRVVSALFLGIRPAVIGMIFSSVLTIGKGIQLNVMSVFVFLAALFLLMKYKISAVIIIPLSGILGVAWFYFFV